MDQPSIDGFNTFVISRAAHEAGFKVVLSGLGGDELLGGYPSFRQVPKLLRVARLAAAVPGLAAAWPRLAGISGRKKGAGVLRYGGTLAGAYLLLIVSAWVAVKLSARLFRVGLLLTGARPKIRQIWRQARLS